MIPLIYITSSAKEIKKTIADVQKKHAVAPYNIHTIVKDGQGLKIEQIREIITLLRSADSQSRLIVVYDFETASDEVQNALLKTLEECPEATQIVLFSADDSSILPTILSRSKLIYLTTVKTSKVKKEFNIESLKDMLAAIETVTADQVAHILTLYIDMIKEKVVSENDPEKLLLYASLLRDIQATARVVEKNNVNPQLAVDHILFSLHRNKLIS